MQYSDIEEVAVETMNNGQGYGSGYDACYGQINKTWYAAVWHVATQKTIGVIDCDDEEQAARIAHSMACGNSEYFD